MSDAEELQLLAESAAGALRGADDWPKESGPDGNEPLAWLDGWRRAERQGLLELFRSGAGVEHAVAVHEQAGRALFGGPLLAASGADLVLSRLGDAPPDGRVLLARGSGAASIHGDRVTGRLQVPDTEVTDRWLVHDGHGLLLVEPPALTPRPSPRGAFDTTRELGSVDVVDLAGTPLPAEAATGLPDVLGLLLCADAVGALDRAVQMTTAYALERTTFGAPIARNQAVAYPLVRHSLVVTQVRLLVRRAAQAWDAGEDDARRLGLAAQTLLAAHGFAIGSECVQLAGGIGFTWEYGVHHLARRVAVDVGLLGGVQHLRGAVAAEHGWSAATA